jgi:hypothetical protein
MYIGSAVNSVLPLRPSEVVSSVFTATAIGGFMLRWILHRQPEHVQNDCWSTPILKPRIDFYTRAISAVHGPFRLHNGESIYFTATIDSSGSQLDASYAYRIDGSDPDALWWSLTAYKDDHLIPNPLKRYSFSKTTIQRKPDGSWAVFVSRREYPDNWIPMGGPSGNFTIVFRLYNPGFTIVSDPGIARLPGIISLREMHD